MPSITRRSFIATGTAGMAMALAGCSSGAATGSQETPSSNVAATQTIVVEGFDWGPNVTKTVIDFGSEIDPETVGAAAFTVSDRRQDYVDDPDAEAPAGALKLVVPSTSESLMAQLLVSGSFPVLIDPSGESLHIQQDRETGVCPPFFGEGMTCMELIRAYG